MWRFRPGLEALKSYVVEEADRAIKLDANERPVNLPLSVRQRLVERMAELDFNRYPDIAQQGFRQTLAAGLGVDTANVAVGNGSSQLLQALCYVFGGPGRKVVFPDPSFAMYSIYAKLADSQPVPVQLEADFLLPPEKVLAAAAREQADLILLCTPNNPTGTVMTPEAVEYVVAGAKCPVAVDEAYFEFHGQTAAGLLPRYPNLVIVRTFSKAYGLASARVGYAVAGREIIALLSKALMPYNINMLSLTAAATVFELREEFTASIAETVAQRERLTAMLQELEGIKVYPSRANFLLFKTPKASELATHLAVVGIGVRDFSNAPSLQHCLRVTVGTPAENDAFLAAVREFGLK